MTSFLIKCLLMTPIVQSLSVDPEKLYSRIREDYYDSKSGLYREYWSPKAREKDLAFNWSVGVTLSALNAMTQLDATKTSDLKSYLKQVKRYWNPAGPVAGFDVLTGPPFPNDRYYDDNCWMVMALVESYEITHEKEWLQLAKDSLKFALSGSDSKLDGGIYWRERDKASKNTCVAAPAAVSCLSIYRHTKEASLLATAKELYAWTKSKLMDPADSLMWDNISLTGKVDKTKWSYNTALMLRCARELYTITGEKAYKDYADKTEESAVSHWISKEGVVKDELQFAHLLVECLSPDSPALKNIQTSLASSQSPDGRFGKIWGVAPKSDDRLQLIHQASALRIAALMKVRSGRL